MPRVPRYHAVLFDLDGTLLDSIELVLASLRHTFAAHALATPEDAALVEGIGTPLDAIFGRFVEPARISPMIETYLEHNLAAHDAMVRPYPGVCEVVHELRAAAVALALVTSKRRASALLGLRAIGIEGCFDAMVCQGDAPRPKPHPDPVHLALASLGGVAPGRAIFVGDSTHDVHAGRAAGVHTAAVLWGPFPRAQLEAAAPSTFVRDAAELRRCLFEAADQVVGE